MDRRDSQAPPLIDVPPTCAPGTLLGNRYRLVAPVTRGSFTEIWRARDEVLGRTVAAKILLPEHMANAGVKHLFRVEALAAARLTHSNVVAVFDTGEHQGAQFIVMEYLAGGSLRHLMDKGPVPWDRAAQLGIEICAALAYAHSAGTIHRDIRPENVLFTEAGHLKVSDFGIAGAAMAARPPSTGSGARDAYVSPETSIDLQPDPRVDVYSVGAVLYECVAGKTPTEAIAPGADGTPTSLAQIPSPSSLVAGLPAELDRAIMKALAVDPAERFPSARAFGEALQELSPPTRPVMATTGSPRPAPRTPPKPPPTVQSAAATPEGTPPHEAAPSPAAAQPAARQRPQHVLDDPTASFLRSEGRWLLPTLLVMVAAAAIVLAIPSVRDRLEQFVPIPGNGGEPVTVQATGAYDPPPGDGRENSDRVSLAFDSDPDTVWSTSSYATEDFGRLKPGVGIYFDLGAPVELSGIRVTSVAGDWEGTIRQSDDGRSWSEIGSSETVGAEHDFDTQGAHRFWMVWITRLVRTPGEGTGEHPFAVAIEQIEPLGSS